MKLPELKNFISAVLEKILIFGPWCFLFGREKLCVTSLCWSWSEKTILGQDVEKGKYSLQDNMGHGIKQKRATLSSAPVQFRLSRKWGSCCCCCCCLLKLVHAFVSPPCCPSHARRPSHLSSHFTPILFSVTLTPILFSVTLTRAHTRAIKS